MIIGAQLAFPASWGGTIWASYLPFSASSYATVAEPVLYLGHVVWEPIGIRHSFLKYYVAKVDGGFLIDGRNIDARECCSLCWFDVCLKESKNCVEVIHGTTKLL